MIFVTVGSMFPFDRLTKSVDEWCELNGVNDVIFQIGEGRYIPVRGRTVRSFDVADFREAVLDSSLVVGHVGMGTVISCMSYCRPMLLMPRQFALGEHTTEHQMHAVPWLSELSGVTIAVTESDLKDQLTRVLLTGGQCSKPSTVSQYASDELLGKVRSFIHTE